MKVKITKKSRDSWYNDYLGNVFEVKESNAYDGSHYVVIGASKDKLLEIDIDNTLDWYIYMQR